MVLNHESKSLAKGNRGKVNLKIKNGGEKD